MRHLEDSLEPFHTGGAITPLNHWRATSRSGSGCAGRRKRQQNQPLGQLAPEQAVAKLLEQKQPDGRKGSRNQLPGERQCRGKGYLVEAF